MAFTVPERTPRTLILCFDGTADSFDDDTTNIVRLFSAFEKERPDRQLCYYQPGIGTYLGPTTVWSPTLQQVAKTLDQALAWYLDTHIMGGYRFLMQHYMKGDKICMFGFSRGAYTARCLAGMLNKIGLLTPSNEEQIPFAYKRYIDTSNNSEKNAQMFKDTFSMSVEIAFVGVWDTVASCGLFGRHLPFTASNEIIRVFRHALALDERRGKFKPNQWHRKSHSVKGAENDPNAATTVEPPYTDGPQRRETANDYIHWAHNGFPKRTKKETVWSDDREAFDLKTEKDKCKVREVWFPGSHADVGGGSVGNDTPHCLANASLVWMVNQVLHANVGIIFKRDASEATIFDSDSGPLCWLSQLDPEKDAKSEMVDQLHEMKAWWILEYMPLWQHYQDREGYWHKGFHFNRGKVRRILDPGALFHSSAKLRRDYLPEDNRGRIRRILHPRKWFHPPPYVPGAQVQDGIIQYVDF
ncbi:hypothetical protein M407DRAFT_69958 [Tulasnella calospora MUT 4182]|uniref:T6SS Phospholipase effector Tle1-like catalytic domain-containing protein n=1 Tax=Tulasnella calospora MUT 4182 TaxID=1051891 RepID=A0A0C3M7Z7_9AGAM|nr:hypothetical protein M407DRAFT_69958 [Tulasnella calospora MUT 4182]